jgi:nudix-type nucleoside diphosphatase (YffH/AdpP family)
MLSSDRVRIQSVEVLSEDWYVLKKTTFDFQRRDGTWQRQSRETYDRGNGATVLLYDPERRTVVLTRQFRLPAYVNGHHGLMIETPAGLLDHAHPEDRIRMEVEEETGFRVEQVRHVFDAYMSPGSVTERLHFFVARYDGAARVGEGGGVAAEGEDIEVLELSIEEALHLVAQGEIVDGKTLLLLQYAQLHLLDSLSPPASGRRERRGDCGAGHGPGSSSPLDPRCHS